MEGRNPSAESSSPAAPLERMKGLLRAKDDTSRFVGLALLKSMLDNEPQLRQDVAQVEGIWDAISPKFLDRLLKSGQNRNMVKQEAKNMVDIAVAVLHTFAILLPAKASNYNKLVGRSAALVDTLVYSSPESTVLILQTLLTFTSSLPGAKEIINIDDLSPLTEISVQYSMALDVLSMAWSIASIDIIEGPKVKHSLDKVIPMLLNTFKGTDGVTLMASIGHTLDVLPYEALSMDPPWVPDLVVILRKLVASRPTQAARSAYTQLAASLLGSGPIEVKSMLFADLQTSINDDFKPFGYLFISLILIDIRSTLPSLLSKLNSPEYPAISSRLTSAFEIVTHFISFLMYCLDGDRARIVFPISPDLLLKIRRDVSETLSLTMEYLRDRWDASVAGAAGLHPSARTGTTATSEGTRLTLTWDSSTVEVYEDDMIMASLRTLALWLKEDYNTGLQKEMGGLMDMLLEFYQNSISCEDPQDFPSTGLTTLEAIIATDGDILEQFLEHQGWEILSGDLLTIIAKHPMGTDEMERATSTIRVLLEVLDHESTTQPREEWMKIIPAVTSMKLPTLDPDSVTDKDEDKDEESKNRLLVNTQIKILELATALIELAGTGMYKRYAESFVALKAMATELRVGILRYDWEDCLEPVDDILEFLDDVFLGR